MPVRVFLGKCLCGVDVTSEAPKGSNVGGVKHEEMTDVEYSNCRRMSHKDYLDFPGSSKSEKVKKALAGGDAYLKTTYFCDNCEPVRKEDFPGIEGGIRARSVSTTELIYYEKEKRHE